MKVRIEDTEPAIKAIKAALAQDARILKDPAPVVRVVSVGNDAVRLATLVWTDPKDYERVCGDGYMSLMSALGHHAIKIL
jgi:small-conductance mechanosensitive channel